MVAVGAAGASLAAREGPLVRGGTGRGGEAVGGGGSAEEPYPALVVDRQWDLLVANRAFGALVEGAAGHLLAPPVNVLRLSLHPEGLAPRIVNLQQWRTHLLERLRRATLATGDSALRALYDQLVSYPGGNPRLSLGPTFAEVAVALRVRRRDTELSFISTRTSFGTALDVTVAELSIESFFPTDTGTATSMRGFAYRDTSD